MGEDGAVSQTQLQKCGPVSDLFLPVHGAAEDELVILEAALHHLAALLVVLQPWSPKAYSPRMKALLL